MLVAVGSVTLVLVQQADLARVGKGPPWHAQSTTGNAGQKARTPFEALHSLWSWI